LRISGADLAPLLAEKEEALAGETPICRLERRATERQPQ
jgi:hypothetical protein